MKLLVIGAGMMGTAAAYDMARSVAVESVTIADQDGNRATSAAARVNKLTKNYNVSAIELDAGNRKHVSRLMGRHHAALSAVPYFFNVGLAKGAIDARIHFADLGGNNAVVAEEFKLSDRAERAGITIAPDCGLSPGLASILAGELMRRIGGKADALKIYVGGLPKTPKPPFGYQLVFSVEGLINEYVEPAKILRSGRVTIIEPLTEVEKIRIGESPLLEAFHTSGGTSTLPETFQGQVGECFEKTLRYPGHLSLIRGLYDLGMFSSQKLKLGKAEITPRQLTKNLFLEKMSGNDPDVTILRVEAHSPTHKLKDLFGRGVPKQVLSFTLVDYFDPATGLTSMMRTTAWPASVVVQMLAAGVIQQRGTIKQETDIPAGPFLAAMERRGIRIRYDANGA